MEWLLRYRIDHVLFWTATVAFHGYTRLNLIDRAGYGQWLLEVLLRNLFLAAIIYVNFFLLVPKYLQSKKYVSYLLLLTGLLTAYVAAKSLHDQYLLGLVLNDPAGNNLVLHAVYNFSIGLFYLAFSTALLLSKDWFIQRDELQRLRIENLHTELQYLKQQINPHFLFNSLNTIYFQIDKANAEARDTLHKFSDMLRYPLYECNGSSVSLAKEIRYLRNYVDLQKLRKDHGYMIEFHAEIADENLKVYPLLMMPLVENAFKHGSHFDNEPNRVSIKVKQTGQHLELEVVNTCDPGADRPAEPGIGLTNTRRRLELLYRNNYRLETRREGTTFFASLILPIEV